MCSERMDAHTSTLTFGCQSEVMAGLEKPEIFLNLGKANLNYLQGGIATEGRKRNRINSFYLLFFIK